MNEGMGNNIKFKTNSNINFNNMNDKNYNQPQLNSFKNLLKTGKITENMIKNMNFSIFFFIFEAF